MNWTNVYQAICPHGDLCRKGDRPVAFGLSRKEVLHGLAHHLTKKHRYSWHSAIGEADDDDWLVFHEERKLEWWFCDETEEWKNKDNMLEQPSSGEEEPLEESPSVIRALLDDAQGRLRGSKSRSSASKARTDDTSIKPPKLSVLKKGTRSQPPTEPSADQLKRGSATYRKHHQKGSCSEAQAAEPSRSASPPPRAPSLGSFVESSEAEDKKEEKRKRKKEHKESRKKSHGKKKRADFHDDDAAESDHDPGEDLRDVSEVRKGESQSIVPYMVSQNEQTMLTMSKTEIDELMNHIDRHETTARNIVTDMKAESERLYSVANQLQKECDILSATKGMLERFRRMF